MVKLYAAESVLTREFFALNTVMFLTYCNIAVFFQFHDYLGTLQMDPKDFGLLIGLFSLVVMVVRPIISPFLTAANAKRWIAVSCVAVIGTLVLYNFADGFWSMALVRVAHGAAYVVLATAVLAKLVAGIPRDQSGRAFGIVSVITVLPYAVVPPLLVPLNRLAGGFDEVLNLSAVVMLLSFPLLRWIDGPAASVDRSAGPIGWNDLADNFKDHRILVLLLLSLVVWTSFTPVFYFGKEHGGLLGVANPGWFFTLSTMMEVSVRLVGGSLFDRFDKRKILAGSLAWLAVGYVALAYVSGPQGFYAVGLFLGVGWGVVMPILSALTFDMSRPRFRSLNTNLAMEMFQAGFFVGPVAGSALLLHGGYPALYYACAGVVIVGLCATPLLGGRSPNRNPAAAVGAGRQ
jgi:predicted MFS family arabinose efflux permease